MTIIDEGKKGKKTKEQRTLRKQKVEGQKC